MYTDTSRSSRQNGHIHGIKKITFWEKYGVKRFPYRGTRRHTPILQQHFDGQISISNDVFGLTIQQFDENFKACLERRKQNSEWIMNLRYPVKSTNEYLEYLKNCKSHDEGYIFWPDDSHEKYVYEQLVNIIGKETEIHQRQRLFLVQDEIYNSLHPKTGYTYLSSGSLAEGLCLPGSDLDIMNVIHGIKVVTSMKGVKIPYEFATLMMEIDHAHPGFSRLKLAGGFETSSPVLKDIVTETDRGLYLAPEKFIGRFKREHTCTNLVDLHGPCISDRNSSYDITICFRCKSLPSIAIPWVYRHRKEWPPNVIIDAIVRNGCILVPIGPKNMTNNQFLWRMSFSVAEKQLLHSFNYTQLLCYGLLKLTLKHIINKQDAVKDLLCSYFLKTTLFWISEEVCIQTFQLGNLFYCFSLCLIKLRSWIENCFCPNYFIPEQNMFKGKVNTSNNQKLLSFLDNIICDGTSAQISNVLSKGLASTIKSSSTIQQDFLFYKIFAQFGNPKKISHCYRGLVTVTSLLESESSEYVRYVCKRWKSKINQYMLQLLPCPVKEHNIENIRRRYHKHLQEAIKPDAVAGLMMYASFYYVIGQYNVTIRITDYVLSKCTPDQVCQGLSFYVQRHVNYYAKHVHTQSINLNDKFKLATISLVTYLQHSSIIPEELKLEIQHRMITVTPVVMCHCLKFLCYYHLRDMSNRQQALRDLCLTIKEKYFVPQEQLSLSLTIWGVCAELSGDKDTAYDCYDKASLCEEDVCITANIRKTNLLNKKAVIFSG